MLISYGCLTLYTNFFPRPPVSLSKLAKLAEGRDSEYIYVAVTTVTDDVRLFEVPQLNVVALRFTDGARARIEKAGGKCLTLDELALQRPTGRKTVLVQGARLAREATKHFRGLHGKHARPYVRKGNKTGSKFERARGRR